MLHEPQVSQKQIAAESGVSIMTVSRVLRGKDDVSPETRERVLEIARKHKYRPNLLVRGIQTGKTNTIGVLLPPIPYYNQLMSGIHDELVESGHIPIHVWAASDADDRQINASELQQIHRLLDRRVDGFILKPVDEAVSDEYLCEVWERKLPLVVIDRELPHTHADFVGTEDVEGDRLVAHHLLELGHKHVAQVTLSTAKTGTFAARRDGFMQTIEKAGARCEVIQATEDQVELIRDEVRTLLSNEPRPTALFIPTDWIVPAVLEVIEELQLNVPDDISIVGFANLDVCSIVRPRLTSVEQFPYKIGREASKLVLERSLGRVTGEEPIHIRVQPKLIVRESTAARPPSSGCRALPRKP